MNGKSDVSDFFHPPVFQTVLDYATSHHLGRFPFWSVNRDRPCTTTTDNGVCSNVTQQSWDFTKFTTRFAGATPPQGPPTTKPPGPCSAPEWGRTSIHTRGNAGSHNQHQWTAKWGTH